MKWAEKEFANRVEKLYLRADYFTSGPSKSVYRVGIDTGTLNRSLGLIKHGNRNYQLGWSAPYSIYALSKKGKTDRNIITGRQNLRKYWSSLFK